MNRASSLPLSLQLLAGGLASHARVLRHGTELERRITRRCLTMIARASLINLISGAFTGLDHALFPGFKRVRPTAPVFVVAPARSGTTLLFNLLASDPQFVGAELYKSIFPAISFRRAVRGLGARLGEARSQELLAKINDGLDEVDSVHRTRMHELEEDGPYFEMRMSSPYSMRFFPFWSGIQRLARLDDCPPAATRGVLKGYYAMVQRVLYDSPERTYLAKAVCSAGRIASLLELFPDARLIHIVRHPFKVIPSALHMHWVMSHIGVPPALRPDLTTSVFTHEYFEGLLFNYQRLLEWERRLPPERWLTLRFDQLIADPRGTVDQVYRHFGIARDAAAERALEAASARASRHRARAKPPTLAQLGLSRAYIHARLRDVFEAYELDPVLGGDDE